MAVGMLLQLHRAQFCCWAVALGHPRDMLVFFKTYDLFYPEIKLKSKGRLLGPSGSDSIIVMAMQWLTSLLPRHRSNLPFAGCRGRICRGELDHMSLHLVWALGKEHAAAVQREEPCACCGWA